MQTQEKFTATMRKVAEARDLDLVVDTDYSNVGTFAFQRRSSFAAILVFPFNFQGSKGNFVTGVGYESPGPLGPRHEDNARGFSKVEGEDFDLVVLRVEEILDGIGCRPVEPLAALAPSELERSETALTQCQHIAYAATLDSEADLDNMEKLIARVAVLERAVEQINSIAEGGEATPEFKAMLAAAK